METTETILATLKELNKRARAVPTAKRGAHFQIAKRRLADAKLFAERVPEHAVRCLWDARTHLNHCE